MWFSGGQRSKVEVDFDGPMTLPWGKDERGRFNRLLHMRGAPVDLAGRGGVVAFFHRGTRPGWIFIGATDDIGAMILDAKDDPDFLAFEGSGGVYVTWALVKPVFRSGVVAYLRTLLKPKILASALDGRASYDATPIPVHAPA